jgi:hypothetical protein
MLRIGSLRFVGAAAKWSSLILDGPKRRVSHRNIFLFDQVQMPLLLQP